MMENILILKDNYNSFERYYLEHLNELNENMKSMHYYVSDCKLRKLFTHYGMPLESIWYGEWKKHIQDYDLIVVFDSIHTPKMIEYLHNKHAHRVVFWHWNPIRTDKDKYIFEKTKTICEHWTFNDADVKEYGMHASNQFFFFQENSKAKKTNSVFFVGKDKGRYNSIIEIAKHIRQNGYETDFHVITPSGGKLEKKEYIQENYLEYDVVLEQIKKSKAVLEIVQEGQTGLTARALEAMFMQTKLITNNNNIINYPFYKKENIFVLNYDNINFLGAFLEKPFSELNIRELEPYSALGWIREILLYPERP